MNVVVIHNQSLLDIAIQAYGSPLAVFDLAAANDIAITDNLEVGMVLKLPESSYIDSDIYAYYKNKNIKPATALNREQEEEINPQGINYWSIELDFKAS